MLFAVRLNRVLLARADHLIPVHRRTGAVESLPEPQPPFLQLDPKPSVYLSDLRLASPALPVLFVHTLPRLCHRVCQAVTKQRVRKPPGKELLPNQSNYSSKITLQLILETLLHDGLFTISSP